MTILFQMCVKPHNVDSNIDDTTESKSKYIKRVHSVKIQRHTDSRADVIDTPSKTTLNIPKKKIKYAQPVPSRRFQYKTIGKMQFEMRKMLFIRKRRFYLLI